MNKIKQSIQDFFKPVPRSALFWNGILYLAYLLSFFIDWQIPLSASALGSLLFLACLFDGAFEEEPTVHLWQPLTFIFWIFLACGAIILSGVLLYQKTIVPFNNWLNQPKTK